MGPTVRSSLIRLSTMHRARMQVTGPTVRSSLIRLSTTLRYKVRDTGPTARSSLIRLSTTLRYKVRDTGPTARSSPIRLSITHRDRAQVTTVRSSPIRLSITHPDRVQVTAPTVQLSPIHRRINPRLVIMAALPLIQVSTATARQAQPILATTSIRLLIPARQVAADTTMRRARKRQGFMHRRRHNMLAHRRRQTITTPARQLIMTPQPPLITSWGGTDASNCNICRRLTYPVSGRS
jgi:hypothetical protein